MWFIVVEVEQETSAPPPNKNPGSAPGMGHFPLENTVCSLLTEQKPKCCWGENYHSKENLPPTRER